MRIAKSVICRFLLIVSSFLMQTSIFCTHISYLQAYLGFIKILALLLIVVCITIGGLTETFQKKKIIIWAILLVISFAVYLASDSVLFLYAILGLGVARNATYNQRIKDDLWIKTIILLIVILSNNAGLATDQVVYMRHGITPRMSLGFAHPNVLGYISVAIYLNISILSQLKNKIWLNMLTLLPLMSLCDIADSRTSKIVLVVVAIIGLINILKSKSKNTNKKNQQFERYIIFLPIALAILSRIGAIAYTHSNPLALYFDELLSGRLKWQAYYDANMGFSWFGRRIEGYVFNKVAPLDNAYYRVYYNFGLFGLLFSLIYAMGAIRKLVKCQKATILMNYVVLLVYGLSEWYVFRFSSTVLWDAAYCFEKVEGKKKRVRNSNEKKKIV